MIEVRAIPKRKISFFLTFLLILISFNIPHAFGESQGGQITEAGIDRIHPLHRDMLQAFHQMKADTVKAGLDDLKRLIISYNNYLSKTPRPGKADLSTKLKEIREKVDAIIKSNTVPDDQGTSNNVYTTMSNLISELGKGDKNSDRSHSSIVIDESSFNHTRDRTGSDINPGGNKVFLNNINEIFRKAKSLNTQLKIIRQCTQIIENKANMIRSNDNTVNTEYILNPFSTGISDDELISNQEFDNLYSNRVMANAFTETDYTNIYNNIESFFSVYYNFNFEYNNYRFPFYKNSYCNQFNSNGGFDQNNIQIQCAVKLPDAKDKERFLNSLFLNSQFLDGIKGGGDFPRENIRITFNRDYALEGIKSIKFYEIDSNNNISNTPDVIQGYIFEPIDTILKKYDTKINPGYVLLNRTSIMADYPVGMRTAKVRIRIEFKKAGTPVQEKDITFVPAYDEGTQILGEDLMYINLRRLNNYETPLSAKDFFRLEPNPDSPGYPIPGGYLADIDGRGNIRYAAYIEGFSETSPGNFVIRYITGFDQTSNSVKELTKKEISGRRLVLDESPVPITDPRITDRRIIFTHFAKVPLGDMNPEFIRSMDGIKVKETEVGDLNDNQLILNVFENMKIKDRNIDVEIMPDLKDCTGYNYFDNSNLYKEAYKNIFLKFVKDYQEVSGRKIVVEEDSELAVEEEDKEYILNKFLDYLLLNIYGSQNLLENNSVPAASYINKVGDLKTLPVGSKIFENASCAELINATDDNLIRALALACFHLEVKKLKLMGNSGNTMEKNWRLPNASDILVFDIPEEIIADDAEASEDNVPYLLWYEDGANSKKGVYKGFKTENGRTWHYLLAARSFGQLLNLIPEDDFLTCRAYEGDIVEYKLSDKLFWQLLSASYKTPVSTSWYNKISLCPANELGYLRYRDLPYYYYADSESRGEVLVDPDWIRENIKETIAVKDDNDYKFPVNSSVSTNFESALNKIEAKNIIPVTKYSAQYINKDPRNTLDSHSFGIALDMAWGYNTEIAGKAKLFEVFSQSESRWNTYINNFAPAGFVYGGFHGVNSLESLERNHFEAGSVKTPETKYIQEGMIVSDVDVSEYKLLIDRETLLRIDLFNIPGDYDLFLYKQKDDGTLEKTAYSMKGISNSPKPQEVNPNEALRNDDSILKYIKPGNGKSETYILKVLGYSNKLSHSKYVLDVKIITEGIIKPSSYGHHPAFGGYGYYYYGDVYVENDPNFTPELEDILLKNYKQRSNLSEYAANYAKSGDGKWLWPVPATHRENNPDDFPTYENTDIRHYGIDITTINDLGMFVRAVEDGIVSDIQIQYRTCPCHYLVPNKQYYVTIEHTLPGSNITVPDVIGIPDGVAGITHNGYSRYFHLVKNSLMVKKGDVVKKGQIIGLLGNTGNSSGPHLHYEVRYKPTKGNIKGDEMIMDPLNRYRDIFDGKKTDIYFQTKVEHWEARLGKWKEYLEKMRGIFGEGFNIPDFPRYYDTYKTDEFNRLVPQVECTKSSDGVSLEIDTMQTKLFAVSALIMAESRSDSRSHSQFIADVIKFRDKFDLRNIPINIGSTYSIFIDWSEKKDNLNGIDLNYYLVIEVEDIRNGTSFFKRIKID